MKGNNEARRWYAWADWYLGKPMINVLKRCRNEIVSRYFERLTVPDQSRFVVTFGDMSNQSVLFTIAFNAPWAIELLIRSTRRHMPDWTLVVIDNSNRDDARIRIADICRRAGIPYLQLPRNPEWSPNRSHGIALNWVWQNIVKAIRPRRFGFIDHDCFAYAPVDIADLLDRQPVYGLRLTSRRTPGVWYLWAGFMFFDFASVGTRRLDFNHDQALGLDTAGRLWDRYFSELDAKDYDFATSAMGNLPSVSGAAVYRPTCIADALIHVGGASYRSTGDTEDYLTSVRARVEASLIGDLAPAEAITGGSVV